MDKISAVIITKNEARNIGRCLDSLKGVADEIVVVDSLSTDETPAICKEHGVTFIQQEWQGYSAQKNFANQQATHDYIYSIDADEAVSDTLRESIREAKRAGLNGVYSHNRLTNYCGKWVRHMGWYPDRKIRLFPKAFTSWEGDFVHEELHFTKPLKEHFLLGDLEHYSYYNAKEHRERADKYSVLTAQKLFAKGKKANFLKPIFSPIGRFISMYFLRLGILDGAAGWNISRISAASNRLKYKELNRLHREHQG